MTNPTEKINKAKVKRILVNLQKINQDEISKENGLMDFDKLKESPEIKRAIKQLNMMGVTKKYLRDNFFLAGMTIGHFLEK